MNLLRALLAAGAVVLSASLVLRPTPIAAQTREGVGVRGHWVIEVLNPDGTLVERREFDNALAPGGSSLLAQYLGRIGTPARWSVELGVYGGATSPCNGGTFNTFPQNSCLIVDRAAAPMPTGTSVFPTLDAVVGGPAGDEVVLTGSATAVVTGQIVYVATRQGACGASVAPASCNNAGTVLQFTVHDLVPTPLTVAAGQIVQVTVSLSFS